MEVELALVTSEEARAVFKRFAGAHVHVYFYSVSLSRLVIRLSRGPTEEIFVVLAATHSIVASRLEWEGAHLTAGGKHGNWILSDDDAGFRATGELLAFTESCPTDLAP